MSSSTKDYSKEFRSCYSRSSSYNNNRSNSLSNRRLGDDNRLLSSLLNERDFPSSSIGFDGFDDPFFSDRPSRKFLSDFDRPLRRRFRDDLFDDQFFKRDFGSNSFDTGRNIPINYRGDNNSSSTSRNIPVQYSPSSTNQREKVYKKLDESDDWTSNSFQRNNQNIKARENRILSDNWTPNQETPTRKRTSMTIFVRQPNIQYSDVSQHQRATSTAGYPTSTRTNYY